MKPNQIKVAIVDDHVLFREGIKLILSSTNHISVCSEYKNGLEFINDLPNAVFDVVLMDISMPVMNGIEASQIATERKPELKILALSMFGDEEYYYKMVNAGAKGFILKESKGEELTLAIEKIAAGENYFSQELLRKIIFNYNSKNLAKFNIKEERIAFTEREFEVLNLLCQGMTNSEIAESLYISQRTAEGHRANLLKKTGTKNTIGLIMHAIKTGIISI